MRLRTRLIPHKSTPGQSGVDSGEEGKQYAGMTVEIRHKVEFRIDGRRLCTATL